ncbi:MAG TPA: GAF domain-containing sensor histidine kinase [Anaerolineae bacterium]
MSLKEITYNAAQSTDVQVARLEMMLEISRALNSTLDLDVLLQSITEVATELTDTEAASILLLDRKTGELYFEATSGEKRAVIERIVVPLEGSIAGWIARNGEPLVIDDIQRDGRHYGEIDKILEFKTRSILGVPLKFKQEIIGVVEVLNKRHDASFSGDDVYILNTLASQAAIAIENARLFAQSDQLADMIHELRTPISSVIGFIQLMLLKPKITLDEVRDGLENIYRESSRLSQMINDFLDLSQLETGRTRLEKTRVNLHALLQEVVELFYPQAQDQNITLTLDIEHNLPEIMSDANRLKQVLVNLVDNAIKYSKSGGLVTIMVSFNEVRVQISVRDTGLGIAQNELEAVFDKFYRVPSHESTARGSGLGLPIAKKIIEAHKGDIWVESEVGTGSTFTFSLPLDE